MITPEILHYFSAALTIAFGAIGGGIGQGIAGSNVMGAMDRQPTGSDNNFKALILGLALIESGIIIALVITLLLLFTSTETITWGIAYAEVGIAIAVGVSAAAISIASAFPVKAASEAISRQPFFAQKILTTMLLAQSIIEAAVIFSFIIALLIRFNISGATTIYEGLRLMAAGIAMGLGCIGPSIGQAIFAHSSCKALGVNKNAYGKIFPFTLLSQAVTETPLIFCLLIALIIIYTPTGSNALFQAITIITAAVTIGLGSIGTATGIGYTASKASLQIAREPENYPTIVKTALLIEAFIESSVIYAMIISLLLIMKSG